MDRAEYTRLREKIEHRYRRDLDALDRVWEMSQDGEPAGPPAPTVVANSSLPLRHVGPTTHQSNGATPAPTSPDKTRMDVISLVRKAIPYMTAAKFDCSDIFDAIISDHPDLEEKLNKSSITSALNRLVDSQEIYLLERGAGKRATVFQKTVEQEAVK
jgi:hypothetical protein